MLLEIVNFSAKTLTRTGNGLFIKHNKKDKRHIKQAAFVVLYISIDQNPTFISSLLVRRTVE